MSLNSEIDAFTFENKIRTAMQELIAPTIRRTIEVSEIVEKVQKRDHTNADRLDSLEYNVSRLLSRIPLLDDIYKHVQELQSEKQTTESLINLKFESLSSAIQQNKHENENQMNLTKANEDALSAFKSDVVDYTESLNGVKDILIHDNSIVSKKIEKTRMQAKEV